jgi:hypothetical protein
LLRYGIDDIRILYENDVRFLKQFWWIDFENRSIAW